MDAAMNEELKAGIQESRKALQGFRWFGSQVQDAMNALDEIEQYIDDPQSELKPRIAGIVREMKARLGPYSSFLPVLVETLTKLDAWLEQQP
jgi:hypothetical protein